MAVSFGAGATPAAASTQGSLEDQLLAQLNAERAARGLPALIHDAGLVSASRNWAGNMSGIGLVHSKDGRAEIIARGGRTGQITDAWMRSTTHRNLIVDANLRWAGVGVHCDSQGNIWAVVQFTQADTSKGTLSSSPSSPIATPASSGSSCAAGAGEPAVRRLYRAYFGRESDREGLNYWVGRLNAGATLGAVSNSFAGSAEFQAKYGSLSNRDFVRLVYQSVLGRDPDQAGYDYWTGEMSRGLSRGELMIGFSESAEFRRKTGIA